MQIRNKLKRLACKLGLHKWLTGFPFDFCEWCGKQYSGKEKSMDKVIEAMAKELALQTLGDDGLPTSRVVWEWVVTNDFTEEYYDKAKALLNLAYPGKDCPACGGIKTCLRGKREYWCDTCNGTGVIPGRKMLFIADKNQELPRNPNIMPSYIKNYNDAQQDMLNSNWRKVVLE